MITATYLYCLVRAPKAPSLSKAPKGLPGAGKPRALDAGGGLWLVAADAPLDRYGEKPIEKGLQDLAWVSSCAMPHEAVVEHFGKAGTVVPMKLFTLFRSDERALEHVARERRRIDKLVQRIEGREEWGLRVSLDELAALDRARSEARRQSERSPPRSTPEAGSGAGGVTGSAFLLRKKKEQDAARELMVNARNRADALFEELSAIADESRRRPPPPGEIGKRMLLDAAFLLRHGKAKSFQSRVREQAKKLGKLGYQLTLTGPWPPYSFVVEPS